MAKVFEAVSKNEDESLSESDMEANEQEPVAKEPGAFLARKNGRMLEPVEKINLRRATATSTALAEKDRFRMDEFALMRKALTRTRSVTLDPERLAPHLVTLQELPSPDAEQQYRRLAVGLITATMDRPFKRILFTSAQHGEGRTSVLLNLAGTLARARKRVLVIETDFTRPSVMRLLGLESEVGMAEVFNSDARLDEAAITIQPYGITVLATREAIDNPAEILASSEFRELLNLLEQDFDFILFDSPPLLHSADANLLTRMVDTTLLVIRPGKTSTAQMAQAVALLDREDISGVVMNRVPH
jgi:capsular exopolysaccharide synthesis family protein